MGGADCTRSAVCRALQILKRISCMVPKTTRPRLMAVVVPAVPLLPWTGVQGSSGSGGLSSPAAALQGLAVCITRWPGTGTGTPEASRPPSSGTEEVRTSSRGPVSRFPSVATQPETSVSWARPGGDHGRELTLIPAGVGVPHTRPAA